MLNKMEAHKFNDTVDILIVDDREDGLIALEAILYNYKNYNVVKASSGLEAYELLYKHDFAVILLDVQMPHMDGFETAELMRSQKQFSSIPILFVTAINKDDRYIYRGYESGAVDYIFKPFDPMILKSKVAVFADLHLKTRQIKYQAGLLSQQEALEHRTNLQSQELESLKRYRNLADAIPHMVWRASADGTLEYYNQLWYSYTGLTLSDSLGVGWQKALSSDDLVNFLGVWDEALRESRNFETEARIRSQDGSYRWQWIKAVCEKDEKGNVVAWLGTCTDIHDRKIAEKDLMEAKKEAESANQSKTQFLANMSHEIRTPLNAIIGFTELMLDPHLTTAEKMNNLSIVRRNGQQLLKIIDEILDISKVEAGGLEIEEIETNLLNLISGIKSLINVHAIKKKINLDFKVIGQIPEKIITDSTRLRQILLNIVGNAVKFTNHGYVLVTAEYLEKNGKSFVNFIIEDTGVGLTPANAEKIFLPFHQADSSTTRIYGGTGLGLALSRKLARAMAGDVSLVGSESGKGSKFKIEIEAPVVPGTRWVTDYKDLVQKNISPAIVTNQQELLGTKILLVEDALDNQLLISRFLQKSGALIDIANNGQEGISKALENDYEIVLMDIQMPLIDGYEATSRLRQAGYKKPIIALTAHALVEERDKCIKTGCDGHLTKPIDRQELIKSLVKYVGTQHLS